MKTETTARRSRHFSWLATVLLGLLAIQITGCTDVKPEPEGSAAMKQQALSFTPPPGKAGIYIIRPHQFYNDSYYGNSGAFPINLDCQEFGSVEMNSYLFALVSPGKHFLVTSIPDMFASDSKRYNFTTEAGKNYYFTATGAGLTRFRSLKIDAISETDGQAFVREFKLSRDNRFDLQNQPGQTQ